MSRYLWKVMIMTIGALGSSFVALGLETIALDYSYNVRVCTTELDPGHRRTCPYPYQLDCFGDRDYFQTALLNCQGNGALCACYTTKHACVIFREVDCKAAVETLPYRIQAANGLCIACSVGCALLLILAGLSWFINRYNNDDGTMEADYEVVAPVLVFEDETHGL